MPSEHERPIITNGTSVISIGNLPEKTNARLRWKFYQFTLTILFIVDFILLTIQYSKLERMPMLFRWMRPFMILVSREKIGHVMLVIIRVIIRMYRFWVSSIFLPFITYDL